MSGGESSVSVSVRCRPLRLAFLVPPNDRAKLERVLELNTTIWGGRFNAIVPVYRSLPKWWTDERVSPTDVINGYLHVYDPDHYVLCGAKLPAQLDLDPARLVELDAVSVAHHASNSRRTSVLSVYEHLHETEHQYVRRRPTPILLPQVSAGVPALLAKAAFGHLPTHEEEEYVRRAYEHVFEVVHEEVDPSCFLEVLSGRRGLYPINVAAQGLSLRGGGFFREPVVFLLDGRKPSDVIDYWNLRALGWRVLPVDYRWRDVGEPLGRAIASLREPRPNQRGFTLLKGRSISRERFESFAKVLKGIDGLVLQDWYPRLWRQEMHESDDVRLRTVESETKTYPGLPAARIAVEAIRPPVHAQSDEWANVIQVHAMPGGLQATALPPGLRRLNRLLSCPGMDIHSSHEGLVATVKAYQPWHSFSLPDGVGVAREWFAQRGYEAQLSDAGRTGLEVLRAVGGPTGSSVLASPKLLKLLHSMAEGLVEEPVRADSKPRARGRTASIQQLKHALSGSEPWLQRLLDAGVLRPGMTVECKYCGQRNWYSVADASETLTCERCLRAFPFPAQNPASAVAWAYRTQGAFATGGYAQGSYSVALALRVLQGLVPSASDLTWSPAVELAKGSAEPRELDFAAWWQSSLRRAQPASLVVGECKSNGLFEEVDFERLEWVMKEFPGVYLVLSTFRHELQDEEVARIRAIAQQRRAYGERSLNYSPLIVLTGHELMARMGPPYCWEDLGDRVPEDAKHLDVHGGLPALAAVTQHLHLGIDYVYGPRPES